MKKGIIVLLIMALVAGYAFAGFSGSAKLGFTFDVDSKDYGFANSKGTSVDLVLAEDKIAVAGEADIYASIKASFSFRVAEAKNANLYNGYSAGVIASISEAKIYGDKWFVDITGAKGAYDYAKSAIDVTGTTAKKDPFGDAYGDVYGETYNYMTYKAPVDAISGITAGYDGYTVSVGLTHNEEQEAGDANLPGTSFSATVETKQFVVADEAVKIQAAAEIGQKEVVSDPSKAKALALGASVKASYEKDEISVAVAGDLGVENLANDAKVKFDAVVSAGYDFVSGGVYYNYAEKYLSAYADVDLNSFDVPATVSVSGYNLTASDADIDLAIDATYDGIENVALWAGYSMNLKDKGMDVYAGATYTAEKFDATVVADLAKADADADLELGVGAYVSSKSVVDGATLSCGYAYKTSTQTPTNDLLGGKFGAIELGCKIAF